jgi:hypothetical protein
MFASFERFEIELTRDQATTGYHQGQCDDDIAGLLHDPLIQAQLNATDRVKLQDELREYGAWDDTQLSDHDENLSRILWLACGQIVDEMDTGERA